MSVWLISDDVKEDFLFTKDGTTLFENAKLARKIQRQLNAIVLSRSSAATKQTTQCKSGLRLFRCLQEKKLMQEKLVVLRVRCSAGVVFILPRHLRFTWSF